MSEVPIQCPRCCSIKVDATSGKITEKWEYYCFGCAAYFNAFKIPPGAHTHTLQGNSIDTSFEVINGGKQSKVDERCDLLPPNAILSVARVLAEGAKKYDVDNWRKLPIRNLVGRAFRHICMWLAGDKSEPHLEHATCRMMMALDLYEVEKKQ